MRQTFTADDLGFDVDAIDARLASGRNLPSHCYTDPTVYEFELATIFDRSWQYFTPRARVAAVGDVVTGIIGRTPVIVTRAADGALRGFVNACRHRGYTLVEADTHCSKIQCAYHSWIYDLAGSLARTPKAEHDLAVVPDELGLHPVSVTEWGHAVWVNPDPTARPLLEAHPRLVEAADELGIDHTDLDRYQPRIRSVTDQASNWKLWLDNGTECYHCPTVHRQSFGAAYDTADGFTDWGTWDTIYGSHFTPASNADSALVGGSYRSFQPFPATQYIQQDGLMVMARAVPTGPATMTFVVDYLIERGTSESEFEEWVKLWELTYDEDARVVESIQQNLASGRITDFRYVAELEGPSRFMHGLVWDAYQRGLGLGHE